MAPGLLIASAVAGTAAAAAAWILRRSYVVVTVQGESMSPTLAPGDRVLVRRGLRGVRSGVIVVVGEPDVESGWLHAEPRAGRAPAGEDWYIKRVVATEGMPYPNSVGRRGSVPRGHVALLGDHVLSADSREHGPCPTHQVLGVMVRRVHSAGQEAAPR